MMEISTNSAARNPYVTALKRSPNFFQVTRHLALIWT